MHIFVSYYLDFYNHHIQFVNYNLLCMVYLYLNHERIHNLKIYRILYHSVYYFYQKIQYFVDQLHFK
jgi:hypothetical protein